MRRKYGNKPTLVDGHMFDSLKEANHYIGLKMRLRAGQISKLEIQPEYLITINSIRVCKIIPDFRYVENGKVVVSDVKSPITRKNPVYRLKAKLLKAVHGVEMVEA